MQNALKLFAFVVAAAYNVLPPPENEEDEDDEAFENITTETVDEASALLTQSLVVFTHSVHLEVQERACFVLELLKLFGTLRAQAPDAQVAAELAALFDGTLNPVAKGAQRKVTVPEDLDLDTPINPPDEEEDNPFDDLASEKSVRSTKSEDEEDEKGSQLGYGSGSDDFLPKRPKEDSVEAARQRRARNASNPFHLGSRGSSRSKGLAAHGDESPVNPVVIPPGDLGSLVVGSGGVSKEDLRPKRTSSRKVYTVKRDEDTPEGADDAVEADDKKKGVNDALSSINLDEPLGAHEVLPVQRHRTDIEKERKVCVIFR